MNNENWLEEIMRVIGILGVFLILLFLFTGCTCAVGRVTTFDDEGNKRSRGWVLYGHAFQKKTLRLGDLEVRSDPSPANEAIEAAARGIATGMLKTSTTNH